MGSRLRISTTSAFAGSRTRCARAPANTAAGSTAWYAKDASAFYAVADWETSEGASAFFEEWDIEAEPGEVKIFLEGDVGLVPLP